MPARARTLDRVEVKRTDEVTSQRYLALATLKAPQNLPQHAPDLAEILPQHDLIPFSVLNRPRRQGYPTAHPVQRFRAKTATYSMTYVYDRIIYL